VIPPAGPELLEFTNKDDRDLEHLRAAIDHSLSPD
jgi:hypothetical protein